MADYGSDEITQPVSPHRSSPLEIARAHREERPEPFEIPEKIGPYKIISFIDSGGMGDVYLAEQSSPQRTVAIKIVSPRRRTKEVLARFEVEREALALMDHPNIATVYGAGEADDGRPYFVMEYVQGIPITDYCDKYKLNTTKRLTLFVDVCRAVHHAHQKGIIHRDIKPGNILVCDKDDRPIVKIIDFGVAKATQQPLTARTLFTDFGQPIGTPGYMSPEQVEPDKQGIDSRADVYSLGVLLYELLVGAQPFDVQKIGYAEFIRVVREVDPPAPSTKLTSLGDDSTTVATNRSTAVRTLTRELHGDLDVITMTCLEKNRKNRYDSASALADEVERHLRGEPIVRIQGRFYKFHKFVRRHRFGVGAGTAIAASLIAGLIGTTVQYARAERGWTQATFEKKVATQVTEFLIDSFKVTDPNEALGNKVLARDILDQGARRIAHELKDQPLVQAAMMDAIGSTYSNLGLYKEAEELLRKAVEIRKRLLPPVHQDTATALHHLGVVLDRKGDYQAAEACHREGLAICEKLYGREHINTMNSLAHLGSSLFNVGRLEDAATAYLEVYACRQGFLAPDDPRIALALVDLGVIDQRNGDLAAADSKYKQALDIYDRGVGRNNPDAAECLFLVADAAFNLGRFSESEKLHSEVLSIFEEIYGADDVHVGRCLNSFGNLLAKQNRTDEAEVMARRALAISSQKLGENHSQTASDLNLYACVLRDNGNLEEAEQYHRRSLAIRIQNGPDDLHVGVTRANLGLCLMRLERFQEAEKELLEASRIYALQLPDGHPRRNKNKQRLVELYEAWGRPEKADPYRS